MAYKISKGLAYIYNLYTVTSLVRNAYVTFVEKQWLRLISFRILNIYI